MKRLSAFIVLYLIMISLNAVADDRGPAVSIELRDVELKDVLRAIGQEHRINIIVDESATGKVTVSLRNVPLWDAIESILKGKGFTYIKEDNIVRVIKASEDEELVTHTVTVSYANPKDVEGVIKKIMSKKGEIASDSRSNTIIIKDLPANIPKVEALIRTLDTVPPQVMIDARIVEMNKNTDRSLGIQWGGSYVAPSGKGNISLSGGSGPDNFAVNLPASFSTATDPFGAIKMGLITGNFNLDIRLSAMEQSGDARILSNPRIMTANNKKASISTGEKIRVVSNTTGTTIVTGGTTSSSSTEEIEALLKLEVTPQITADGRVMMNIITKKEEFDWTRTVNNIPAINTREAVTDVTIKDGETLVIGGIYTKSDSAGEMRVPYLSKIPLLGWLFKRQDTFSDIKELLIFLTPTIKVEGP